MFRIQEVDKFNQEVIKFNLPIAIIDEFCYDESYFFAYVLWKKIGGELIQINNNTLVVKYKNKYIDTYGIHTLQQLKDRTIPLYRSLDNRSILCKPYGKNCIIETLTNLEINHYSTNPIYLEKAEFFVDIILKSKTFIDFNTLYDENEV